MADTRQKPDVAVIYSDSLMCSLESRNLAFYFAGMLATSGYSKLHMVGLNGSGISDSNRTWYIVPGASKPIEITQAETPIESCSALSKCDVILVTVNSIDTDNCVAMLEKELKSAKQPVAIISLQRGVRNAQVIKDKLKGSVGPNVAVVESIVGFSVVSLNIPVATITSANTANTISGITITSGLRKVLQIMNTSLSSGTGTGTTTTGSMSLLIPTTSSTALQCGMERISKEIFPIVDGPVRLLGAINGLQLNYRRTLTPFAWGVLVYEVIQVVNTLTGGSLQQTIRNYKSRCLIATLIRECRKMLIIAARGGGWKPDMSLSLNISMVIIPLIEKLWLFEMLLVLPNWLWNLLAVDWWYLKLPIGSNNSSLAEYIVSSHQYDINQHHHTMIGSHYKELIDAGRRHEFTMSCGELVYNKIVEVETKAVPKEDADVSAQASKSGSKSKTTKASTTTSTASAPATALAALIQPFSLTSVIEIEHQLQIMTKSGGDSTNDNSYNTNSTDNSKTKKRAKASAATTKNDSDEGATAALLQQQQQIVEESVSNCSDSSRNNIKPNKHNTMKYLYLGSDTIQECNEWLLRIGAVVLVTVMILYMLLFR